jgi:GNAT superfamily N-acetyltransferase
MIDLNKLDLATRAWWTGMTRAQQKFYLSQHPKSKLKVTEKPTDAPKDDPAPAPVKQSASKATVDEFTQMGVRTNSPTAAGKAAHLKRLCDTWNDTLQMSLADYKSRFFPEHPNARLAIDFGEEQLVESISVSTKTADFNLVREFTRSGDGELHVEHKKFEVPEKRQSKGLARKIMRTHIAEYKKMGIKRVTTYANIDVGSYAWAKYGFVPSIGDWDFVKLQAESRVRKALAAMETGGSSRISFKSKEDAKLAHEQVKQLVKSKDPKSMWDLSDLTMDVVYGKNGPTMTLGKALLFDNGWEGALEFQDKDTMRRFDAYTNGAKK